MCCAKNVIDQKEYLKKYLSGAKKKKRDKKRKNENQMNIIDDNVFASGDIKIDEELLLTGEEAPQIVGEVWEEQPIAPKVEKWRSIIIKDEPEDDKKTHVKQESNVWDRKVKNEFSEKRIHIKSEQETLPNRKREHVQGSDSDLSPPQRGRKGLIRYSDSDLSIPGRRRRNSNDSDFSLPRARRKHTAADSDNSISIKSINNLYGEYSDSDGDLSLPRQRNKGRRERRIQSPVLISKNTNSNSDLLTKQKHEVKSSWRASPVEIKREKITSTKSPTAVHRKSRWKSERQERTVSPPPTHKIKATLTLEGKKAGLQNAEAMKVENEARRQMEKRMFDNMSTDISGRDAEVGVRSSGRRGKRARDAEEEDPEEMRRREERELKKKDIYDRWGKGLKQVEDRRTQLQEEAYESSKPLARSRDDADLDKYLRDQERLEDPMLEYMREKKRERMKELNIPVMPKYEGSYPENRFTIRPGYRWDGVDRSNGYEKRWFEVRNERKAREEEAYKYSVEDM